MADERMKAVVEDDEAEDERGEVGREEAGENRVENELELSLSLAYPGWNAGFVRGGQTEGNRREKAPCWEQAVGSSQFFEPPKPLEHFDLGQVNMNDWVEMGGYRRNLLETEFAPQANVLLDESFMKIKRKASCAWEKDSQHKRSKVLASQEDASSSSAEATAPPVVIDFIKVNSLHSLEDKKPDWFSNDNAARKSSNGKPTHGDTISTKNAEDVEFKMDLSDDLLHLVFSFLEQKDLCRAAATCKQWLVASMHENFWKYLKFGSTRISQQNVVSICHRYPNATEVSMCGTPNADALVTVAMNSLRHLGTLILEKGHFSDAFFHVLTDCPALTSLKISDASIGNGVQEITVSHERLCNLQIVKCRVLRITVRCLQVRTLSLKRSTMAHALLTCPQLYELDLSSCHKLSDTAIRLAALPCPLLASLDVSSCLCLTDETIREIASTCPNLSILDASNCPHVSFESVRLPMLVDLRLESCEAITSTSISAIAQSQMLKSLKLDNCGALTSISLDLPHLQNISLVYLRKFVNLDLWSPALKQIKISRCSALRHISINSDALQKLVLQKQECLSNLSLQCQNLVEVDLSFCESLTNSLCEVFSNGGGCPKLRSLILDNCQSLTIIKISSCTLVYLSLDGCRAMTTLELSCPNLQEVNLDGCDQLEGASFCPVDLELLDLGICPRLRVLRIEAPKMLVLELKGCGVLSEAYINCPCLKSLDASFCRKFSDESLSRAAALCPHIESLVLSSCLSVGLDGPSSLHLLGHLTMLDLSYTFVMNLRPIFDNCLTLLILRLSACKYLIDSSLDALYKEGALPALRELDLSYSSVGQLDILELSTYCTNLVHLNLNGCANLRELVWSSRDFHSERIVDICSSSVLTENDMVGYRKTDHQLEILNCTGCPNITKALISSTANCSYLSKLNLNLSINLKEVDLTCTSLIMINLSYCSSLEFLRLDCPRLNNLQLLACSMLAEEELVAAISKCHMLEIINIHSCPKIYAKDIYRWRKICPSLRRLQSCQ
ncbi:F-box/LRR-repeat protein 15-like [Canna indica]|uniref:F-box/LRR-repeat protein 15-like n=1 Tax=Canna indica TaxID=4628 RepID=A0AAQ3K2Y7_9LILI|nr:F-box/LRR-repeat protein 15-like [Canna indica]